MEIVALMDSNVNSLMVIIRKIKLIILRAKRKLISPIIL